MKRLSIPLRVIFTLLVIAILAACAPGEQPPSAEELAAQVATSVAMTIEAQGQIATSVALTVAAQETEAAEVPPTVTPTPTQIPTITPVLVTETPVTLVAPSGGGGGGGGGSSTPKLSCDPDIRKRPIDNSEYRPGDTFDIKFTIKNTGTATWPAGYDLTYYSGPKLAPAFPAIIELPELKPGEMFAVGPYDAFAPAEEGKYVMTFKLQSGFCWPYIAITVR